MLARQRSLPMPCDCCCIWWTDAAAEWHNTERRLLQSWTAVSWNASWNASINCKIINALRLSSSLWSSGKCRWCTKTILSSRCKCVETETIRVSAGDKRSEVCYAANQRFKRRILWILKIFNSGIFIINFKSPTNFIIFYFIIIIIILTLVKTRLGKK